MESGNETYIFLLIRGPYGESSLGAYFSNREFKEEEDNCVGYITWHGRDDGVIAHIEVNPEMRRMGLATELYNLASLVSIRKGLYPPKHNAVRSRLGNAWAESTNMPLPLIACEDCGDEGHYEDECPVE